MQREWELEPGGAGGRHCGGWAPQNAEDVDRRH
eukprot:COSAG04_NODE_16185_length_507_cov_1.009804_1_plen_32_part_10